MTDSLALLIARRMYAMALGTSAEKRDKILIEDMAEEISKLVHQRVRQNV